MASTFTGPLDYFLLFNNIEIFYNLISHFCFVLVCFWSFTATNGENHTNNYSENNEDLKRPTYNFGYHFKTGTFVNQVDYDECGFIRAYDRDPD